ncbi:MAG TPA: pseudaminic acid synthase [Steroidobacteraceae bacterium]|jgi:N-acetylneuraminate synthase|nr:pseudaminic acid synthase [Steroidobacteraceae bacterium]
MQIDGRALGSDQPPYVIAEISNNHLADVERACRLIDIAARSGADAVKIQTFDADSLTIDSDRPEFLIRVPPWEGLNYYQLYKRIALPRAFTERLFRVARDCGITLFSSPFDESAVALLQTLDCPAYKIASFEACDDPLLRAAGATGKPIIVSTGVANLLDIEETLRLLHSVGASDVALLHCVSSYPAAAADMNIRALDRLARFGCLIGLSDHSLGPLAATLAVARGAALIEKHFTISRADGGPDASFSLEPDELVALVRAVREAWEALGSDRVLDQKRRPGAEHARSLFVIRDIPAGAAIVAEDLRAIRPGLGLPPRNLSKVLGARTRRSLARGEPLTWEDIEL